MSTSVLLSDLLSLVRQDLELNGRAYARNFFSQIKPVLRHFKDVAALTIKYADIERYKLLRLEEGAAPATVNHELGAIRRAYNLGQEAELIDRQPRIKRLPLCNVRQGFLEVDQLEEVLRRLPPDLRDFCEFCYWTGWRRGEVRELRWPAVEREFVTCIAQRSKNRHSKRAAIAGPVAEVIERRKERRVRGSPYVFHRDGRPIKDFRYAWIKAVASAGLPDLRLHDFRRSFVRNCVRAGIPERIAMELSGHRTRAIFDRYNIVDEKDLHLAGRKLVKWKRINGSSSSSRAGS